MKKNWQLSFPFCDDFYSKIIYTVVTKTFTASPRTWRHLRTTPMWYYMILFFEEQHPKLMFREVGNTYLAELNTLSNMQRKMHPKLHSRNLSKLTWTNRMILHLSYFFTTASGASKIQFFSTMTLKQSSHWFSKVQSISLRRSTNVLMFLSYTEKQLVICKVLFYYFHFLSKNNPEKTMFLLQ